ncbi:MAG: hypothetical protein ABSH15_01825 [Verrucomicrobiota bacterium]|jgi:hypothetical protein
MTESKTSCPKCGGHVIFPNELSGQAIACPHCNETFFLPKLKSVTPWVITAVFALIAICLGSLLVFQRHKGISEPQTHSFAKPNTTTENSTKAQPDVKVSKGADDQAIENLCKEFYDGLSAQDAKSIYGLLSESCKKALNPQDIFIDGAKYDFENLESVQYQNGNLGRSALAKVRRRVQSNFVGSQEGLRDLKFVKESDGWKYFPMNDLARKIVSEFIKSGFTDQLNIDIQLLRDGDPFTDWNKDNTNAFEAIFKFDQGRDGVFPWDLEFAIISNTVDGMTLVLNYSIRNKSSTPWPSPLLEFNLKRGGKIVLSGNDLLPNVQSGQELQRSTSFFLAGQPQQTTKYDLDVSCPDGFQNNIQLVQNIPLEFKVHPVSELAKLEIVGTQFDQATSEDFKDMLSARIDYRVKNISSEPIQSLDVKCVWYSLTGEQLDQSTEYVISYGDVPLGMGQFKTGFVRCGKGYSNSRVPVKVDVYLESGEKRSLVVKGLLIQ